MAEAVLRVERVFKKFRRGEIHDSLRDLIPALTGRYLRSRELSQDREFWALRDVSFDVGRGEAVGIIGRNGAGKSTMLKLLTGIMKPTRGEVAVRGRLSALIEVGAGFHPDLTGRENIFLNGSILGMSKSEIRGKFDQIVEFSGLAEFIDTPVKRYSSGMYARLGFAVAAHVDPDVLLVDEVLSVGDHIFQRKCTERMRAVVDGGTTVVFVSHNLRAVAELCKRSILIDRGEAVADGPTDEVIRSYLDRSRDSRDDAASKPVYVSAVTLRDAAGPRAAFRSGEPAWLDIEFAANEAVEDLTFVFEVRDEAHYQVFTTSTDRLGHTCFSMRPGDRARTSIALDLHLAQGTFHVGVYAYRPSAQRVYDYWFPATTFYVRPEFDVRGAANLYPRTVLAPTIGGA